GVGRSRALSDVGVVARDEYAIVGNSIVQVGRAHEGRRRRVRHIEDVEALDSGSADSDVGVVALDVDRRLVERREIALTYAHRSCRVRYVEYLEAIGVAAALDDVGVLAFDEQAVAGVMGQVGLSYEHWRVRVNDVEYLERINRAASFDDKSEAVCHPDVVGGDAVA